ncbi:hypothetical protein [Kitasatospora viridis]|uniref:Uncharacterized protein n=1 Tax=Kitasatospora viridis TaxID=281105 RepID=A0A561SA30_9ACTN|nr:hypothetical protein [Kitasatospora viridis]TWF71732.1 hypothetical protein FHX73_18103 [Kitasatospora viridis]
MSTPVLLQQHPITGQSSLPDARFQVLYAVVADVVFSVHPPAHHPEQAWAAEISTQHFTIPGLAAWMTRHSGEPGRWTAPTPNQLLDRLREFTTTDAFAPVRGLWLAQETDPQWRSRTGTPSRPEPDQVRSGADRARELLREAAAIPARFDETNPVADGLRCEAQTLAMLELNDSIQQLIATMGELTNKDRP